MQNSNETTSVFWIVENSLHIFDDPEALKRWKDNGEPIHFEFGASNADDGGEAVLKNKGLQDCCHYALTPKIANVDIQHHEDDVFISAEIEVFMDFKNGLTQDDLHDWNIELGGILTATIYIDDEATYASDEGSWFELVRTAESMAA